MRRHAQAGWQQLRAWPAGQRFKRFHRKYAHHCSGWVKWLAIAAAVVSFIIGVVLSFMPGPGVLFFALSAALVALLSRPVARRFDVAELKIRKAIQRYRAKRAGTTAARKP